MAEHTEIEWCDRTWSPWEGCTKVSVASSGGGGCDNCYAAARNQRWSKGANWGAGAPRRLTADWTKPMLWNRQAKRAGLRLKVFPSICDPFDNEVPVEWRSRFYELCNATPHLTWLLLTKRIGNVAAMASHGPFTTLSNVWLGATVANQAEANRDIPKLLATPARVRFLSIEPMLGPIDLQMHLHVGHGVNGWFCLPAIDSSDGGRAAGGGTPRFVRRVQDLHWIIAGGESGPHARPAHPDWFRLLRDQCAAAGVPFLFKQWGEWVPADDDIDGSIVPVSEICGDIRYPEGRRVRTEWLSPHGGVVGHSFARVGKKAAGRVLDGMTHDGFPEVS